MPAPARTSLARVVAAAREAVEAGGLEGLTLQRVAEAVGVRAPSLYKHVRGRDHLVALVIEDVARELSETLDTVAVPSDPGDHVRVLAEEVRRFAHRYPRTYSLLFSPLPATVEPDVDRLARASARAIEATGALVGPDRALEAARTLVAWLHGFVSMELAGAFRLGGEIDEAFRFGVETLVRGLAGSDGEVPDGR